MIVKKLNLIASIIVLVGLIGVSCSYHNDDNPNEYPDVKPLPEPDPEPQPDINETYLKAIYTSNCYMVKPQKTIRIPIVKAYAMWSLYQDWLSDSIRMSDAPQAVLLWQDHPRLIETIDLVAGDIHENDQIVVKTNDHVGNAVVAIKMGGKIRWSWHLWVTRYDPNASLVAYGKTYSWDNNGDLQKDYVFMDRNLGATLDKPMIDYTHEDSLAVCGLLYQWGRKDPFPGDHDFRYTNETDYNYFESKPLYNLEGHHLIENGADGIQSIKTDVDTSITGLEKSFINPMTVYLGTDDYSNWYCSKQPVEIVRCDTLWSDSNGKTPFDPCPEGWRIPSDKNDLFVWNNLDKVTEDNSALGVFPYAGFRYRAGGGCLKNSGFSACLWTGTPPTVGNARYLSIYIVPRSKLPAIKQEVGSRSDGRSVRCVKCE